MRVIKSIPILNTKEPNEIVTAFKVPKDTRVLAATAHHNTIVVHLDTPVVEGDDFDKVDVHLHVAKADFAYNVDHFGEFIGTCSLLDGHIVYHIFYKMLG